LLLFLPVVVMRLLLKSRLSLTLSCQLLETRKLTLLRLFARSRVLASKKPRTWSKPHRHLLRKALPKQKPKISKSSLKKLVQQSSLSKTEHRLISDNTSARVRSECDSTLNENRANTNAVRGFNHARLRALYQNCHRELSRNTTQVNTAR